MKPGDNVYFFSDRKIYGIGELVAVGPDCKYSNFPDSSACESVAYADVKDDLLVDFGSDSIWYRWLCTFKAAPYFFEEGIDTDEVLVYKPDTFKMLRAFWKVSFIKLGDEENESLREIFLLRHQNEMITGQHIWERDDTVHDSLRLCLLCMLAIASYAQHLNEILSELSSNSRIFFAISSASFLLA